MEEKLKVEKYELVIRQIESLADDCLTLEPGSALRRMMATSVYANAAALVHEAFSFWWTGFYFVCGDQLVLGPFQGPVACTRIAFGKGVCGTSWAKDCTLVVPDVEEFPGHIACSSASRSEIVVPIHDADGCMVAVIDIDSQYLATFDDCDALWLERIAEVLGKL